MKAINIQWDIDEEIKDGVDLPEEIEITDDEEISDYLSDKTGFCHKGYQLVNRFRISDIVTVKETGESVLITELDEAVYTVENRAGEELKIDENQLEAMEASYEIPVTWEMCGKIRVSAKSAAEAMAKAEEELDYVELPDNGEYVDGSFEVTNYTEPWKLWLYQDGFQKLRG